MILPADLRLVFWEATAGCNLECIHCRRLDVSRQLMRNDLSTGDAIQLVESIADVGKPILVLSGGEPLLRSDIFGVTRYALALGLTVSLATNGTLVDEAMARRIALSGIRRVAISIDGIDAKTHDDFRRQPGSLSAALAGYRRLLDRGLSMQINATITRHNRHQMDELYRMALDLRADALHLFMLVPVGCGATIGPSNQLSSGEYEEVLEWIYARSRERRIHIRPTCAPHYFRVRLQKGGAVASKSVGFGAMTRGCLAGSSVCFVSHTGDVFPCGYLPLSAGNVRRAPFRKIWTESDLFERLRRPDELGGKCGVCEYRTICLGCRARAYSECGDCMAEEPLCAYTPARLRRDREASLET